MHALYRINRDASISIENGNDRSFILNCRLLQIIGGALKFKMTYLLALLYVMFS